ncbi:DUF7601 domain-containing protein [Butyrivibrio sp. MC2013]|uniref:DUF7601 domain-containing protein n=1 Tax=Butyrivibrio sp. MC2013 TaxID=1280686 RepID=UPI0004158725|nr:FctA domain-containing protein [Butyrivibrio sp. MC2013]
MRNNVMTRTMAITAAGLMACAMTMTANAAAAPLAETQNGSAFVKEFNVDADTYAPVAEFSFSVEAGEAFEGEAAVVLSEGGQAQPVYAGVAGGVTASAVSFDALSDEKGAEQSGNPELTYDASVFTKPGIYHYVVTEDVTADKHYHFDTVARDLYLYVVNGDNGLEVSGAEMFKRGEDGAAVKPGSAENKNDTFVNTYGELGDEALNEFNDLYVTKTVTGDMADMNEYFDFEITVVSYEGERTTYMYTIDYADADMEDVTDGKLTSGQAMSFKLKNDDKLTVQNLADGDTYLVAESSDDFNQDGYISSCSVNGQDLDGNMTTAQTMGNEDVTVEFVNEKNSISPTGVVVEFGPYIAMLCGAGALAAVFMRKKTQR